MVGRPTRPAIGSVPPRALGIARDPLAAAKGALRSTASAARLLQPVTAPLSPIMGNRSLSLHLDTMSASLPAMKAAAKLVDGRLNDAFLAGVAGGLAQYHLKHGAEVEELRMTMPINIRPRQGGRWGATSSCRHASPSPCRSLIPWSAWRG